MAAGDWKDLLSGIQNGNLALVRYHIEQGVDPNYQHPEFLTTPLIESTEQGQYEIAEYLLENGADATIKAGFSNDSPLKVAQGMGNEKLVKLIQQYLPSTKKSDFWMKKS